MGLIREPDTELWLLPAAPPDIPPVIVGADQLKFVPTGIIVVGWLLTGLNVKVPPLQIEGV